MILLKAFKSVGVSILGLSLISCVIVTGSSFLTYLYVIVKDKHKGVRLFNAPVVGFAFVETYIFCIYKFRSIFVLLNKTN